jgi:hypothetical protein
MAKKLETRLEIKSWDEKPYRDLGDGRKFNRAEVLLFGTGDGLEGGTFEGLLYYRADGTSAYVTVMHIAGSLDGRTGSLVLQGDGGYDGTTARSRYSIVDGTGELAGISGTAESVSTHADYPYMPLTLEYELG